ATRLNLMSEGQTILLEMPFDLDFRETQELRVDVNGRHLRFSIEGIDIPVTTLPSLTSQISLFSDGAEAAFSAFRLTQGFEELFENERLDERGWAVTGKEKTGFHDNCILITSDGLSSVELSKKVPSGDFE